MKKLLFLFLFVGSLHAQGLWTSVVAKEYSKDVAIFQAKDYLMTAILKCSGENLQFEVEALAAATSLEVITLWYKCELQAREGLIIGFYGYVVNEQGLGYYQYDFRDFPKENAIAFISKIDEAKEKNNKWLQADDDVRNVCFTFEDISILLYQSESEIGTTTMRLFWKGFDATWEGTPYARTKKRLFKKMD